jgi:hypothetical protein
MATSNILDFIGRVNIAFRTITEIYPQARFLHARALASDYRAVTDPTQLDTLKVVCRTPGTKAPATGVMRSEGYESFLDPEFIDEPWLGDYDISWPPEMNAQEAHNLMIAAGYRDPYHSLALCSPIGPKATRHPYFIFGDKVGETFVFVDTLTKEVSSPNGRPFGRPQNERWGY